MSKNVKREPSETPANSGRRQVMPRPQDVAAAAAAAGAAGRLPSGPHAHPAHPSDMHPRGLTAPGINPGQRIPPMGTFPRAHAGPPVPIRGLVNTARINP